MPPHPGERTLANTFGDAVIYPARVAARAWRDRLETAADDVLSAPETARVVDRALAGPLTEEITRSLVQHRVLERVVRELAATGELDRLLDQALASDAAHQALERIVAGPEIETAIASRSRGLGEQVIARLRRSARALDARLDRRTEPTPFAGVISRALALAADALAITAAFAVAGALAGLVASLVGGVKPHWLAGTLLAAGWLVLSSGYFTLFWFSAGQTPGMRLMRLRVEPQPGIGRALARTAGLALAIVPCFLGFVPMLFDSRRRALPDYLAGTAVLYEAQDR